MKKAKAKSAASVPCPPAYVTLAKALVPLIRRMFSRSKDAGKTVLNINVKSYK